MNDQPLPAPDTLAYRMLALTAICGEVPVRVLYRLPGGEQYKEKVITSLKKEKLLRVHSRDHLRGYRLGRRVKTLLLAQEPERFSFFLTGNADTNLLKSEVTRRLRLHRVAAVIAMLQNAGIHIFRDEKPDLFAPDRFDAGTFSPSATPVFYCSREIKAMGPAMVKVRGSRMAGVLLTATDIFLTYHNGHTLPKWDHRSEQRAKGMMWLVLCMERLSGVYSMKNVCGLLICDDMQVLKQMLTNTDPKERCFFLLERNYEHFYYLTDDRRGELMLQLLYDPVKRAALDALLLSELQAPGQDQTIDLDALDAQGRPVLFSYLPDIPRLNWYIEALIRFNRPGCIACFDFQARALKDSFGPLVSFLAIDFEKIKEQIFPGKSG